MLLSDRDLRREIEAGRLVIEPHDTAAIQPASIDLRVGRQFRVFANSRYPYIDVRQPMDGLTELVEVKDDEPFILHPGEFVLGTTLETVTLPDDLVGRLEGKSSLGRLGLLIHSSLPGSEPVMFLDDDGGLRPRPIAEIVSKQLAGRVVAFDQDSLTTSYQRVTGWFEGPVDRIFEVVLASGRRVRVTAGHNLFCLDRDGQVTKVRTGAVAPGTFVAIPRSIPDPPATTSPTLDLLALVPEPELADLVLCGAPVDAAFTQDRDSVAAALRESGFKHVTWYQRRRQLPLGIALQSPAARASLASDGDETTLRVRGARSALPVRLTVDDELAWLLGLYVAEGYRRRAQVTLSNTDQQILSRAETALRRLGVSVYRAAGAVTACSDVLSRLVAWIGVGGKARSKRIPHVVYGWPRPLLESFLTGFVDGDGSRESSRTSLWTSSDALATDLLLLATRLGLRAAITSRFSGRHLHQVMLPHNEHKLLTTVPLPDRLLRDIREDCGLNQRQAARLAGYRHSTSICNLENRTQRDALRLRTARRLADAYTATGQPSPGLTLLHRLAEGDVAWDRVVEIRDTGRAEPIYDLEVRPSGRAVENFIAGLGGVFVSNTAGFIDAGWSGHLTLELSNVANLPITIYPGMKIGQLCLFRMSSPAERPYGSPELGSKYKGQVEPTPSKYFENFE